jgi:hypothetical protein
MLNFFRSSNLERILSTFEKTAIALATHIEAKATEAALLIEQKLEAERKIIENSNEVQKAERVLAKIKEFVS